MAPTGNVWGEKKKISRVSGGKMFRARRASKQDKKRKEKSPRQQLQQG